MVIFYSLALSFAKDPSNVLKKAWFFQLCTLFYLYFLFSGLYEALKIGETATNNFNLLPRMKAFWQDQSAKQAYYEGYLK